MKDKELKDREVKIKREIEELFFKPITVSIDDMDRFELKEMKKKGPIKNTIVSSRVRHPLKKGGDLPLTQISIQLAPPPFGQPPPEL